MKRLEPYRSSISPIARKIKLSLSLGRLRPRRELSQKLLDISDDNDEGGSTPKRRKPGRPSKRSRTDTNSPQAPIDGSWKGLRLMVRIWRRRTLISITNNTLTPRTDPIMPLFYAAIASRDIAFRTTNPVISPAETSSIRPDFEIIDVSYNTI